MHTATDKAKRLLLGAICLVGLMVPAAQARIRAGCESDNPADIIGTQGHDRLVGTQTEDVIAGLGGDDLIFARRGSDHVCGNEGSDRIFAGRGADVMVGGRGHDYIKGGRGRYIGFNGGPGNDVIDGRKSRQDVILHYNSDGPITVRIEGLVGTSRGDGRDLLIGIEEIGGSDFGDRLIGSHAIYGRGGDDRITLVARTSYVSCGHGDDIVTIRNGVIVEIVDDDCETVR